MVFDSGSTYSDSASGFIDISIYFGGSTQTSESFPNIMDSIRRYENFYHIAIPRPGCSNGGLNWEIDVKPIIEPLLDDRFIIYSLK